MSAEEGLVLVGLWELLSTLLFFIFVNLYNEQMLVR